MAQRPFNINSSDLRSDWKLRTYTGYETKAESYPPSKLLRKFILKVGLPDNEWGREIVVWGRSNFEAGLNVLMDDLVPNGYVAHSLVEARGRV